MAILYYAIKRRNPQTGEQKWYPQKKSLRGVGLKEIADAIAEHSGVSSGDAYDVIINIPPIIRRYLRNGQAVNLDGLGSFDISLRADMGCNNAHDVNENRIRPYLNFRTARVKDANGFYHFPLLEGLSYEKESMPTAAFINAFEHAQANAQDALEELVATQNLLEEMKADGEESAVIKALEKKVAAKKAALDRANDELMRFE